LTNSSDLQRSNRATSAEIFAVSASLLLMICIAAAWVFSHGYILYYGDAQSHLKISRTIIDSRTPGYDQLGTVWLPVLHLVCLPFVGNDWLWSTGLAGTIPVAVCFVIAGVCFYLTARDVYANSLAALVVVACFALNPNLLYLASIPMTEVLFLAGLAVLLFALFRFRITQDQKLILLAAAASWSMTLTRYDGWFLIPFAGLGFALFAKSNRFAVLMGFGGLASLAPLYWLAHNYWETGDALDFYRGPYSAKAIQGARSYPGYHDLLSALRYYAAAGRLCAGWPLIFISLIGVACSVIKRVAAPILFLLLIPLFYVWSIYSSSTPIHVPHLWPFSYYNTRYGIAVLPLAAFAAGAIVLVVPLQWRRFALALPVLSVATWLIHPSKENWICWKESQMNSESRRAWTKAGAEFLHENYQPGDGLLMSSGDLTGILCQEKIHIAESLHEGNGPAWLAATSRPEYLHREKWAIAQAGDFVSKAIDRANRNYPVYRLVQEVHVKDAPVLEIYRRTNRPFPMDLENMKTRASRGFGTRQAESLRHAPGEQR
jgi:hypothetical protein